MDDNNFPVTASDILEAQKRLDGQVLKTPVLFSAAINSHLQAEVFFKCENFQHIGAFKARGALNAALTLPEADRQHGLATHSSGNHAQAVARAAKILGVPAFVVMPDNSPAVKKKGVRNLGASLIECQPTLASREKTLADVIEQTGAAEIHPFNDYRVIAGQATAALELLAEISGLDYIVTPVGGGGLLSGTALAVRYFSPNTKVIGAEPADADDTHRSLLAGSIQPSQAKGIAEGLLTTVGTKTFPIIQKTVREVITVSDDEIIQAMVFVWENMKMLIEPSAAVAVAAVLKPASVFTGKRIGIIVSGGNVDLGRAVQLMER